MNFIQQMTQKSDALQEDGELAIQNYFDFFCPFCESITSFENKGNFSKCSSCLKLGSNFWQECYRCCRGN